MTFKLARGLFGAFLLRKKTCLSFDVRYHIEEAFFEATVK